MTVMQIIFLALLLDYLIGDPDGIWGRVPHPAVLMGDAVDFIDRTLNTGAMSKAAGIIAMAGLGMGALLIGWALTKIPDWGVIDVIVLAILLAHKSLVDHVRAVIDGLTQGLAEGRLAVSHIVGRNTEHMDVSMVSSAAIESAAENYSDGVIAPLFWYLILGIPGLLLYKVVNTADSMIGHRNERYEEFGWAAARLDDGMNYIPARLCGALFAAVYRARHAFDLMISDGPLHRSLNAGWPEAAMAGVLGVRLSGPRIYDNGELSDDSYINPLARKELDEADIDTALSVLKRTWIAMAAFFGFFAILAWIF